MKQIAEMKAKEPFHPLPGSQALEEANSKIKAMIEKDEAEAEAKKKKEREVTPNDAIAASEAAQEKWDDQKAAMIAA